MLPFRNISRCNFRPFAVVAACILIVSLLTPARAAVTWNWSSTDASETGTFITDGNLVGNTLPAGTYTLSDFSVTHSTLLSSYNGASLSGGQITVSQTTVGLIWNGSAPTQFFRSSGALTNGFDMYGTFPQGNYGTPRWILDVNYLDITDNGDDTPDSGNIGLTVTPSAVPEPASLTLLALGGLTLLTRRRRA